MKTEPDNLSTKYLLLSTDDEQAFWRTEAAAEGVESSLPRRYVPTARPARRPPPRQRLPDDRPSPRHKTQNPGSNRVRYPQ